MTGGDHGPSLRQRLPSRPAQGIPWSLSVQKAKRLCISQKRMPCLQPFVIAHACMLFPGCKGHMEELSRQTRVRICK